MIFAAAENRDEPALFNAGGRQWALLLGFGGDFGARRTDPAAQDFEEGNGGEHGEDRERRLRRADEREARRGEESKCDQEASDARGLVAQCVHCVVEIVGPEQEKFHSRASCLRGETVLTSAVARCERTHSETRGIG